MADEQELRIVATLDDRASAGLNRLQQNVRQLGSGQQAQAMEGLRRQSGEVAGGLQQLSSGFSSAALGMTSFTALAAAVPVALAGMAASFIASGVGAFADNLNRLGREADAVGTSLAQYRANISTLRTAGISEQEAAAMIRRFTDVQEQLSTRGSQIRQQILAATPLEGRDEMQQWLNNVMVAPAEQAMTMVQQRGEQIREGAAEQARAQAREMRLSVEEQNAYAEREGAAAQRRFLSMFGAEALMHVRRPFREATQEEIALQESRRRATEQWSAATSEIGSAWSDIKETMASILITPLTPVVQALAQGMRVAADAARVIEAWMKDPEAGGLDDLLTRLGSQFSGLGTTIRPIKEFFENPGQGLVRLLRGTEGFAFNLQPNINWGEVMSINWGALIAGGEGEGLEAALTRYFVDSWNEGWSNMKTHWSGIWAEGMANMREAWGATFDNMRQTWEQWTTPIRDFFANPGQGILDLINRAVTAFADLVPQSIREFFANPGEGIVDLVNRTKQAAVDLIPDQVLRFFQGAVDGLMGLIARIREALADMIPAPLRRLLGIGETPPPGVQQLQQQIAQSEIVVPQPPAEVAAEPPPQETPATFDERFGFAAGGPIRAGQSGIVGEAGPELFTPDRDGAIVSNDALRWGLWGASQIANLAGAGRGVGGVGHAIGRAHAMEGASLGDIARGVIPGMGLLETMRRDEMQEDMSNPLRTRLRAMFGIEDPGEPTRWQQSRLDLAQAAADLDESAAQQVNVSGTGRIRVDVRAPEGTTVDAQGEGLFKSTEIMRQTQMLPADYGPAAATGINAGTGTLGNGTGG